MKTENKYPYDLQAIRNYGIEKWFSEFQSVLHPEVFQKYYRVIFKVFSKIMEKRGESSSVYWSGVVHYKISRNLSLGLFRFEMLNSLKQKGFECLIKAGNIVSIDTEKKKVRDDLCKVIYRHYIFSDENLKETLRLLKINFSSCGLKNTIKCLKPDFNNCVIADPEDAYVKAFCSEKKISPMCLRTALLMPSEKELSAFLENPDAKVFIDELFNGIIKELPESKVFFDDKVRKYYTSLFINTVKSFELLCEKFKKHKLGTLLLESLTNAEARLPAAVWKYCGGQVIGFAHGNAYLTCIGGSDETNGTHLVLTDFVVTSKGEADNLKHLRSILPSSLNGNDRILTLKKDFYANIRKKEIKIDNNLEISNVMIVGFPMDNFYYPGLPSHDAMTYAHLTFQIMKDLKKAGYKILYKAHPDTLNESEGVFDSYADEIITEGFEKVYEKADCILFPSPYSTTFGFTVMTDKPIVYMRNQEWNYEPPLLTKLLHQRSVPVAVKLNASAVLEYDSRNLLEAIKISKKRMNTEVIEKFAK
jgi:hypothetical protein